MPSPLPYALINIDVPHLAQAEVFYVSAFGLQVGRRFGDSAVELLGLGSPLYLLEKPTSSAPFDGASQNRSYERHWTPVHIDIVVDNIEAALENARNAGAVVERALQVTAWGKIALLADPFGHGFCLIQFLGRGYDEIASSVNHLQNHRSN